MQKRSVQPVRALIWVPLQSDSCNDRTSASRINRQ